MSKKIAYSCVGVWKEDGVEVIANDQDNPSTSPYVAFTEPERLIGRKSADAVVWSDVKLWPFKISSGTGDKPLIEVNFNAEEISAMILTKMKEVAESTAMKLLISELQPAEGVIWRHQSMRLTYVAQHAVHQLEERQDKIEESWLAPWFIHPKTLDISVEAVSLRLWGNHPRVDNCQKVIVMVCCLLC